MERVVVAVCSADPLVLPGIDHLVKAEQDIDVVSSRQLASAQVALVMAERIDSATLELLGRLSRSSAARMVLIVDQLTESDLAALVRCRTVRVLARQSVTAATLADAFRAAARCVLPTTDWADHLMGQLERVSRGMLMPKSDGAAMLAPRERDLLRLLADGYDTTEIADRLAYSERTVKNIVHNLLSRLELRNRAHAVAFAMRSGAL